jgi:hypothetical protein
MSGAKRILATLCSAFFLVGVPGCSSNDTLIGDSDSSQPVAVIGEVKTIDDQVPVDGGVTIDIELDDGGSERLLFGSLFTSQGSSQERLDLYQVIVELEIGDLIEAKGTRTANGIEIDELTILDD